LDNHVVGSVDIELLMFVRPELVLAEEVVKAVQTDLDFASRVTVTQTELCHFHISLRHSRASLAQEQLGVQPDTSHKLQSPLASVAGNFELLTDGARQRSLSDSE
jgi:hypothetical protein